MEVNQVFTIEPIITLYPIQRLKIWHDNFTAISENNPNAQFEHTLLIVDGGCEILTKRPSENIPNPNKTIKNLWYISYQYLMLEYQWSPSTPWYIGVDCDSPPINKLRVLTRHARDLCTLPRVFSSQQLTPNLTSSFVSSITIDFDNVLFEDQRRTWGIKFQTAAGSVQTQQAQVGRHSWPRHRYLEFCIEIASKVGTDSLIGVDLD